MSIRKIGIFKPHKALEVIKSYLPPNPLIVEAGAYNGRDTCKMAKMVPCSTIHAFEPVPALYQKLRDNTRNYQSIFCHNSALSVQNGTATFYTSHNPKTAQYSPAGSLHRPKERLSWSPMEFNETISVPTITLDSWAEKEHIDHIDLLWLDLQGHELAVMQASPRIMQSISVIYTEVSFIDAYEDQPHYYAVKSWLEDQGFVLVGCDFENMTDWFFGNALFIKNDIFSS